MGLISPIKTWAHKGVLTHGDLNAEFKNLTDNIVAATATAKGMVELATNAEVVTGTDTERAVTPAGLHGKEASISVKGIVQLEDSHASTSITKAACPKNVKEAYDLADGKSDYPGAGEQAFLDTDHTKLNGIEASATADQTGTEIKTLYQGQANAYTDTKNTKLANIEANATKYPDTGEQAFLDADHTKLDGIEAAATKYPDTGEQAFLDADHTKLNGIETGADVTGSNTPQAHKTSHQNSGSDEINVGGLSGLLADDQHVLNAEVQAVSINNVAEDATPQLGGDLDCNSHAITSPTDPTDEHGVGDRGYNDIRYTQSASGDLANYKIPTGSAIIIEAFKQLFIADEYIIEGTGVLTINDNGLLAIY